MNDYNTAVGGYDPDETPEAHPSDLMNEDEQAAEESRIAAASPPNCSANGTGIGPARSLRRAPRLLKAASAPQKGHDEQRDRDSLRRYRN